MVKKKISGQTIVIIILAILLLLTIAFGGVFAYYSIRTNRVTGQILLANLDIRLTSISDGSDQSEIIIYNDGYVVPGQQLNNSPLVVRNLSTVDIYLIVVYEVKAQRTEKEEDGVTDKIVTVEDQFINPVFGLGCEYYNSNPNGYDVTKDTLLPYEQDELDNETWYDFVFKAEKENKYYRCMVSKEPIAKYNENNSNASIDVIGYNQFSLNKRFGPEYISTTLTFTFQAYAMGAAYDYKFKSDDSPKDRCHKIVNEIYAAQGYKFLDYQRN